jgi:hypothetical protein
MEAFVSQVQTASPSQDPVAFNTIPVQGIPDDSYTSLQFGPDGRLYVSDRSGEIRSFNIVQTTDPTTGQVTGYTAVLADTINAIADIPNHNDDGTLNTAVVGRQVTGILVEGTATQSVIYVSSSDPRAGGFGQPATNLDTNSGIISQLTWNGTSWDKVDLVHGLPRSDTNHSTNGLALGIDPVTGHQMLYVAQGANTDAGAPSSDFGYLNEYALSSAILSVDLTRLQDPSLFPIQQNGANSYVYDIPTVEGTSTPFGGMEGLNQARLVAGGPVQVYASGFRNPYDIVITSDGRMFSIDNGANAGKGGLPQGVGTPQVTNQVPTNDPDGVSDVVNYDHLELVTAGYYAGHPNPTRANSGAGVLYTAPDGQQTWIQNPGGAWPPVDPSFNFQSNSAYLAPGVGDKALTLFSHSTDGLAEYTAGTFGGALKGDLVAASLDGNIYQIQVSPDSTSAIQQVLASNLNGTPLDVTTQGDSGAYLRAAGVAAVWINATGHVGAQDVVSIEIDARSHRLSS